MGGLFGGGGGGGDPPKPPHLMQVDTSLTGPLYTQSSAIGDQWANLMRGSYGLGQSTGPASWEAQYLGPGALANMGQAKTTVETPGRDPQVEGALKTAFGGRGGAAGSGAASWDIGGTNPYAVAQNLGQQYKNPLGQLQRGQQLEEGLLNQWKPPDLRLTGEDLLSVATQQAAQNAQGQQAAFEQAIQSSNIAANQQNMLNATAIGAAGKIGSSAISGAFNWGQPSSSLSSSGYYQPPAGAAFGSDMAAGGAGEGYSSSLFGS